MAKTTGRTGLSLTALTITSASPATIASTQSASAAQPSEFQPEAPNCSPGRPTTIVSAPDGSSRGPNQSRNRNTNRATAEPPVTHSPARSRFTSRTLVRKLHSRCLNRVAQQAGDGHRADPARHRRDRARDLADLVERDVAEEPALEPVHADVDDRRAGLDPVAADHLGAADRSDQDVGAARHGRQVARTRMTDGHRGIGAEQ